MPYAAFGRKSIDSCRTGSLEITERREILQWYDSCRTGSLENNRHFGRFRRHDSCRTGSLEMPYPT